MEFSKALNRLFFGQFNRVAMFRSFVVFFCEYVMLALELVLGKFNLWGTGSHFSQNFKIQKWQRSFPLLVFKVFDQEKDNLEKNSQSGMVMYVGNMMVLGVLRIAI